jgi:hypothetical protein
MRAKKGVVTMALSGALCVSPLTLSAQEVDICPILAQLISESERGYPRVIGDVSIVELGWYRCRHPIPGSTTCKIELKREGRDVFNKIEFGWQRVSMEDAVATAELLAESAAACDVGEFIAPSEYLDPEDRRWRIRVDGGVETSEFSEGVTIIFRSRFNTRVEEAFAMMSVNYGKVYPEPD